MLVTLTDQRVDKFVHSSHLCTNVSKLLNSLKRSYPNIYPSNILQSVESHPGLKRKEMVCFELGKEIEKDVFFACLSSMQDTCHMNLVIDLGHP